MPELILFYTASNPGQPTHEHVYGSVSQAEMALRNPNRRHFSYAVAISGGWSCEFSESDTRWTDVREGNISSMHGAVESVTLSLSGSSFAPPFHRPISGHVILFERENFRGEHKHIFSSENLDGSVVDTRQFDNETSSIIVLSGLWGFYQDQTLPTQNANLRPGLYRTVPFVGDNSISAVRSDPLSNTTDFRGFFNQITLFEHENHLGRHKHVFTSEPNLASPDDFAFNDLTSSIYVNSGAWELFRHINFIEPLQSASGAAATSIFRSPESTFRRIGNDSLSSLRPLPTLGSLARIKHLLTNKALHSHPFNYNHPGSSLQQQVTGFAGTDDNDFWRFRVQDGNPIESRYGRAIDNNSVLRLEHFLTHRNLHSHRGIPSPVTGQQEVTCFGSFGIGDSNDNWKIEIEGGGQLRVGKRFKLIHVNSNHALHSHPADFLGQQEVTCFGGRDDNDWWVLEESFDRTHNQSILPIDQIVERFSVNIRIGAEGTDTAPPFRGDPSDVVGYVRLRNSSQPIEVNFSRDQQWAPHSWHQDNVIDLPAGTRLGDIVAFGIRSIHAGPDFAADNWSMDEIEVRFIGPNTFGTLLYQQGEPIHLFLKNSNQFWERPID
jgi:hypothetical protein